MNLIPDRKDAEFTQAYAEHYSAIFGALYKMTRDCDVAEELTQEVFIRFYNKMESAANVRAWLLVTAKYVAYEHHHRQDRVLGGGREYVGRHQIQEEVAQRDAGRGVLHDVGGSGATLIEQRLRQRRIDPAPRLEDVDHAQADGHRYA